ncbi:MAG TPA: 5-formyltetrahydrofolate cyclo-ligase, partial [Candidatus Goldiibacteriota bacterium]|nr:5-formyltetrahydrofolate cyclo-ligase [Candidatus Goldiibacteriota bacterium]
VSDFSRIITNKLLSAIPFHKGMTVMAYTSTQSEVKTTVLINYLHKTGAVVCVPWVRGNDIVPVILKKGHPVKKDAYGIKVPATKTKLPNIRKIDAVIAPGIGFDRHGNRIGFGKGYFDRFLKKLPKKTVKAALAFSCQIVKKIPAEAHDIKMDIIATEKGIIDCRKKGKI